MGELFSVVHEIWYDGMRIGPKDFNSMNKKWLTLTSGENHYAIIASVDVLLLVASSVSFFLTVSTIPFDLAVFHAPFWHFHQLVVPIDVHISIQIPSLVRNIVHR